MTIGVNEKAANMILDSGSQLSYINESFVKGLEVKRVVNDFHPSIGDFKTPIYSCKTQILITKPFFLDYGILPDGMSAILSLMQIDGIIGIDLFKRFRFQLKNGVVVFPPQCF